MMNEVYCFDCENKIKNNHFVTTPDGYTICEDCFNKNWFVCNVCGEICHNSEMSEKHFGICSACEIGV